MGLDIDSTADEINLQYGLCGQSGLCELLEVQDHWKPVMPQTAHGTYSITFPDLLSLESAHKAALQVS